MANEYPVPSSNAETTAIATANGQTAFSFDWRADEASQVHAVYRPVAGAERELVLGSDFSVQGLQNPAGGSILLVGFSANKDDVIYMYRETLIERDKKWQNEGDYKADLVNAEQDEIYMILQENRRDLKGGVSNLAIETAQRIAEDERIERESKERDDDLASLIGNIGSGNAPLFDTKALVEAARIDPNVKVIRTGGYAYAGDGGAALYKRVASEPTHAGKIKSLDGAWWELCDTVPNARSFGAVGDGITDDTIALQSFLDFKRLGKVKITEGNYLFNSDLIIRNKRIASSSGDVFELDATGARFAGSGDIIINSCKRVSIKGFFAPEKDIHLNGAWWFNFENIQFRDLILCSAAGSVFTANYWNVFTSCLFQSAITSTVAAAGSNAFTFIESTMRGDAKQGFTATRDYAFNFDGDHLAQSWTFIGGDVSYYEKGIYNVPASNPNREVSMSFIGTYFDTKLPVASTRDGVRVTTRDCVAATATNYDAPLVAASLAPQDMFVQSRLFHITGKSGVNLLPNGDFRDRFNGGYVGVGRPIAVQGGAVITRRDGGLSGWHLNINQANTSNNLVTFRAQATEDGFYSTLLVLRNADIGSKTVRVTAFDKLTVPVTLSDTEWTVVPLCVASSKSTSGQNLNVHISTNDGTPYNVDVAYAGIFFGIGGDLQTPSRPARKQFHTFTYDPPSIAAGAMVTYAHTVTGADLGDIVSFSTSLTRSNVFIQAYVNAQDTVAFTFFNPTSAAVDLSSMTFRVMLEKPPY